jgi:hypothetical protein
MSDIAGSFTDLRAAINGNLDEVNVPNLTAAFTTYKHLARGVAQITSAAVAGLYALPLTTLAGVNVSAGAISPLHALLYLDPTRFNANTRTTKLGLRLTVFPNSVAPGITFTAGLYAPATFTGASGSGPVITGVGTVISGSQAAVATPTALSVNTTAGVDFNFPVAGVYMLAVLTSGTPAAGSVCDVFAQLEMRQV